MCQAADESPFQTTIRISPPITIMEARGVFFPITLVIIVTIVLLIKTAYKKGLRQIPGPFLARFSGLYRLSLVSAGKAPLEYRRVHEKYGPIVRVGPNHVSISNPDAIHQIYGITSDFRKVQLQASLLHYLRGEEKRTLNT